MTGTRTGSIAGAALVVLLLTNEAFGQSAPTTGEDLFRQGRAALKAGRYEAALSLFEESQRHDPALGTLLNVAVCEEKLGKLIRARAHLDEAHAVAGHTDRRRALIAKRVAELDQRMPRLTVRGPPALVGAVEVKLDGHPIDAGALGDAIAVDPGTHVLSCAGKKGETCSHTFRIAEGERVVQDLQVKTVVPSLSPSRPLSTTRAGAPEKGSPGAPGASLAAAPARPVPRARGGRRIVAYSLAGLAVAGVAGSLIAGAGALGEKREQARHCDETGCDEQGVQAAARGDRLATIATWSALAGLASGVGSLYLFATAPAANGGPPGIALGGSFR